MSEKTKLLITGAAGNIGTAYRKHLKDQGDPYTLRLLDINPVTDPGEDESLVLDLSDPEAAQQACEGMDVVLHLAANPHTQAEFYNDLLDPNFKATYNIFRAAKDQGCRRLIFASSVNAIGGYPEDRRVYEYDAPCPGNVYGASKAFGESLGAYFSSVEGLSNLCIRIGGVTSPERIRKGTPAKYLSIMITYSDLCHLIDRCIEAQKVHYAVVHGASNNRHLRMDLAVTRRMLGYTPLDDAFEIAENATDDSGQ